MQHVHKVHIMQEVKCCDICRVGRCITFAIHVGMTRHVSMAFAEQQIAADLTMSFSLGSNHHATSKSTMPLNMVLNDGKCRAAYKSELSAPELDWRRGTLVKELANDSRMKD